MNLVKHAVIILAHQSNCIDDARLRDDRGQMRVQGGDDLRACDLRQCPAEGQVKMKIVKDKGIAPLQHLLVLARRQRRSSAAGDLSIAQRCAKGVEGFDRRGGEILQLDRLGFGPQSDKAAVIPQGKLPDIKRRVLARKGFGGRLQSCQSGVISQPKGGLQRAVQPVFAWGRGDARHINAVDTRMRDSAALRAIPPQPSCAKGGQRTRWGEKDGISFKHFNSFAEVSLCQTRVTSA